MTLLELDPTACTGRGLCAAVAPDVIELDEWGYPLLAGEGKDPRHRAIPDHQKAQVRRARGLCPRLALRIGT